ncbi:MAG: heavy-metal-associated domain-containing protein [Burkholderiales bacterium]
METTVLQVKGMTCGGCVRSVTKVLEGLPGVQSAEVSLDKANARIIFDPTRIGIEAFRQSVQDAGYEVA